MNTPNNQRFQETEDRIVDAFLSLLKEREPEKITVSQLCAVCHINRSSFYLHFTDVYALMVEIDRRLSQYLGELFSSGKDEWNIGRRFTRFFSFGGEHRDFYRVYLDRCRDSRLFNAALGDVALRNVERLAGEMGFTSENELRYHQTFFKAGLASMLREWIAGGCRETPEEMGDILSREYAPNRGRFM